MDTKKRRVVSYENMDDMLRAAFDEKYPKGLADYLPDANRYDKPDGTVFYAVTIETEDTIALVKVDVSVDAAEDIENWLNSDGDDTSSDSEDSDNLPDDNISQYSSGDEEASDQE